MENKNFFKELILKHFIQIFIGLLFYFYYVGYVTFACINIAFYGNLLLLDPSDIIAGGILGFLVLSALIFFGICIYGLINFIDKSFPKKLKVPKSISFSISTFLLLLLYAIASGMIFWVFTIDLNKILMTRFFFIFFIITTVFVRFKDVKFIRNRILASFLLFCTAIFLIWYPFFMFDLLSRLNVAEAPIEGRPISTVLTSVRLGLPDEEKTNFGYLNKIKMIKAEKGKSIFIDPASEHTIVLRSENVISVTTLFSSSCKKQK